MAFFKEEIFVCKNDNYSGNCNTDCFDAFSLLIVARDVSRHQFVINRFIFFAEYVKHDFHCAVVFCFPIFNRCYGNLRCFLSREAEHTGGNTAKGNRFYAVFRCEVQAGRVAVYKQHAVAVGKLTADNRPYGMQHILAR